MIQVRAIGAAEVQIGRKRITKSTEMVLVLAVYFCVRAGERLTRDEVVDVFWPGRDLAKGRHSLRQMLYRLRLKGFTLDEEGEELHLDPARVDCDATRALAEAWPESADAWLVEDSDEFLPGLTREVSPQFQEWLDATRSQLTTQYRRAALRQLAQARREGRWADLERWGRVVLRSDPLNEEATLARAESAAMAGSKAMALEILDQYVEDLGERAGQIALPATVLRRRISERRPEWGGRGAQEVRLVGRSELMRRLTAALASAARGAGSAMLLFGAPGIGKTRLANELREFAVINGFRVCSVRATQAEAGRPLALAIAIAMTVRDLPGVAGTSPAALALISRLCEPTAHAREPDVPLAHTISPMDIGWALSDAVSAASHESRLLLTIDDLHNADDLSKEVLSALAQTASSQRLLVLATGRSTPRHGLNSQNGPLKDFRSLAVPPLSLFDATRLVSEFAVSPQRPLSTQATEAITRAGGGNPLFLRELTAQRLAQHIVVSAPQSLVEVIEQRTAHLSAMEVRLLRLISTLGQLATLERLRILMPPPLGDFDASLEQLELEGVLSMSAMGSLELHECWYDSIRGALKGTARSAISLDCATLLAAESYTDANLSNYWRAAELFAVAGSNDRSRQQFLLVGELFTKRGLPRQATEALSQAVSLAGDGGREALLTQLAIAQNSASLYSESIESCNSALSLSADPTPESANTRTLALATLVDSQMKLGVDYGGSIGSLAFAVSHTGATDTVCQHACLIALRTIFNSGSRIPPRVFLDASLQSTARSGRSVLGSLVRLIYAAERGTASELEVLEREVMEGAAEVGPPSMRLMALRYRGTALRFLGRYEDAAEVMTEAVATAKALGAVRDTLLASTSLVFLHLDYANFEQARAWLNEAQALAGPTQGHDLDRTLLHATGRYFVDTGDDPSCVSAYADHMESVFADTIMRRAVVDRACLALAFARTGEALAARQACAETIRMLGELSPGISEDWAANTVLRSLNSLGDVAEAEELRASYRERRAKHFDRPIATGLKELSANLAFQLQPPIAHHRGSRMTGARSPNSLCALCLALAVAVSGEAQVPTVIVDTVPALRIRSTDESGAPRFGTAAHATMLRSGDIAIADASGAAVRVFARNGRQRLQFGRKGRGPVEFIQPGWLDTCGTDSLFVWDVMGARMSVFDDLGRFHRSWDAQDSRSVPSPSCAEIPSFAFQTMSSPSKTATALRKGVSSAGVPYEIWQLWSTPRIIDANGTETAEFAAVASGEAVLAKVLPDGRLNNFPLPLGGEIFYAAARSGIVIASTATNSVTFYGRAGGVASATREFPSGGRATRANFDDAVRSWMARTPPSITGYFERFAAGLPTPGRRPAFRGLVADAQGLVVWLVLMESPARRTHLIALDAGGNTVGSMEIPEAVDVLFVGPGYVLTRGESEEGEQEVTLWRSRSPATPSRR